MRQLGYMSVMCIVMLFIVYRTSNYQYQQTEIEAKWHPFDSTEETNMVKLNGLLRGIIQARSDLELKPIFSAARSKSKTEFLSRHNLLAIAVGINQKYNVNIIVKKFLAENFKIILLHYDGNVNDSRDLEWSNKAIRIAAQNQTKWYLEIVRSAGLEISQPALDPKSTEIHHKITRRKRTKKWHRRIYDACGSTKCSAASRGPPCTGWVEGTAPVFSRSAWCCTWHLIQNDLVHGWGLDMKLGHCAKVGVVDSEYIIHQGIQTLGCSSSKKKPMGTVDMCYLIRRQSTSKLQIFKERWENSVKEDKRWVDPYSRKVLFSIKNR